MMVIGMLIGFGGSICFDVILSHVRRRKDAARRRAVSVPEPEPALPALSVRCESWKSIMKAIDGGF